MTRLECRRLDGGRDTVTVFRQVDLEVEAGSVLALLGPNGAGKTTLLLTIAGLLPQQRGEVLIDAEPLRAGSPTAANRAGVVLVPDDRCLFTTLTVEENLQVARPCRGADPRELLELFPALEKRWKLAAGALSGGEQQMLAMARALIQRPRVLLIDEMSMGLAPLVVADLFTTVRRLADEADMAVVLVEQHVDLALGVADRAAVLSRGSIARSGAAADLRRDAAGLRSTYLGITTAPDEEAEPATTPAD